MATRRVDDLKVGDWIRFPDDHTVRTELRGQVAQVVPHLADHGQGPSVRARVLHEICYYWIDPQSSLNPITILTPEEGESTWLIAALTS